jgi:imidazolonepropionase-like amidohydrolase
MRRFIISTLLLFLASISCGQSLVVEGGTLFDGTGAVRLNQTIVIRGDKIESIGAPGTARIPAGAKHLDARGKFIVPGLIDFHFHFNPRHDSKVSPWLPLYFLAYGVTTLREMGNWIEEENKAWLSETTAKGIPVPRLLYSGPVLDGANTVMPDQTIVLLDEMDARRAANWLIDQGATSLKVYARLPLDLLRVVVDEAHRRNVPVHSHLGIVDPRDAIRAGLDGLEHTNTLCQALLPPMQAEAYRQKLMRVPNPGNMEIWGGIDPFGERATALIDLMLRYKVNLDATLALHEPRPETPEIRRKSSANQAAFTVRYFRAGGSVTMGSHGKPWGAPAGLGLHREMELHTAAGMSPADVLQAATRVAARALRLKDRGVLAPGMLADLIVLEADPLVDIANLRRVESVILGGAVLDRKVLFSSGRGVSDENKRR